MKKSGHQKWRNTFLISKRCFSMLILSLLVGQQALFPSSASADRLSVMQKIQGTWQDRCEKFSQLPSQLYQQTKLTISYTHITLARTLYADSNCVKKVESHSHAYPYLIAEPRTLDDGKVAYGLNVKVEGDISGVVKLYPLNLIRFDGGKLYFGRQVFGDQVGRLTKIDSRNPFMR